MAQASLIEDRIVERYSDLSNKLRTAADFVANNPIDVATRSLRSVAQSSGVSPATFSRLARALDFEDYAEMREAGRATVGHRLVPFAERAHALQHGDQGAAQFVERQTTACIQNIKYLQQEVSVDRLQRAVDALYKAKKVLLIGVLGSAGIVDYFAYQAQYLALEWTVAGRRGVSIPASFAKMDTNDVVVALTKSPYSTQTVKALKLARENGFRTIVLTDSHSSPALEFAEFAFIVPTTTSNFFSSYVATLTLIETMMAMLIAKVGPDAEARIQATHEQAFKLGETLA